MVGTDSHTTSHGALGAFAFGIGATEMASVWTLGRILNVEVPGTIKVVVNGKFPAHVGPKDLILHLIGKLTAEGANFKVLEFHGDTIRTMSTSGRLVICNMSVEAGATSGYRTGRRRDTSLSDETEAGVTEKIEIFSADPDAVYEQTVEIDVSKLAPQVACPHTVDNVKTVDKVAGTKIDQVVIGSCTNGRLDDLEIAARTLKGKKVARGTRMLIFPASWRIYREALKRGYLADLAEAGAVVCNPGCGPCLGVHQGALGDQEVALATTNRNFKGRMGNPNADVYLCSPDVAAASAIAGVITDPGTEVVKMGKVVLKTGDDVSTDIIYPGRFMATVLPTETPQFAFADNSDFNKKLKAATKSLREASLLRGRTSGVVRPEQAASCLHGWGLTIVAKHFARIFLQNSINLGLPMLICPTIEANEGDELEIKGETIRNVTKGKDFAVQPLPKSRQAIIDAGGLVPYTRALLLKQAGK